MIIADQKYPNILLVLLGLIMLYGSCADSGNSFVPPTSKNKGVLITNSRACYFNDIDSIAKELKVQIDTPSRREIEEIQTIMNYVGLPQNFKIYRGDIDNAMATIVNNQRLIIYNKDLFTRIDDLDSTYWSSLFIIAHEIGHHLAYNITDTSNAIDAELEADAFAGSTLYKMGADSNQVILAVESKFISNKKDTKTHPAKYRRIEAVKRSWYQASVLRYQGAVPPPPTDTVSTEEFFDNELFHVEGHLLYDLPPKKIISLIKEIEIKSKGVIIDFEYGETDYRYDNYRQISKMLVRIIDSQDPDFRRNIGHNVWVLIPDGIYKQPNAQRLGFYNLMIAGRKISFTVVPATPHEMYLDFIQAIK
jgi:hypothetical protein